MLNNYRPISLLPIFSKILEKVIHHKLFNFLDIYIIKETLDTLTAMDSILPPSDRHAARWICSDGAKEQQ